MEEKYRRIRKVSSFLSQSYRIANSHNTLRQSEIRRSFCFCRIYTCGHSGRFFSIDKTRGAVYSTLIYIIQCVGFGEPDMTMIEAR